MNEQTSHERSGAAGTDVDLYLREYRAGGYLVAHVVGAACAGCGCSVFTVLLDDDAGYAERACISCGDRFVMLDSADFAEDAEFGEAECPCGGDRFEVAIGFAVFEGGDVRWVSVGLRCIDDGQVGVYADWRIDYGPSGHLLTQV